MRLAALGIIHEANTFARGVLDETALARAGVERGAEIETLHASAETTMAGFLAARDEPLVEVIPLLHAMPTPTGPIARATFEAFVAEMLALLEEQGPWDGILLALHGAAVAEGHLDADAEITARVRSLVGPGMPIGVALDLHANLSPRLIEVSDVTLAYHTNPHIDARERARRCANIVIRAARGEIRPTQALERPPACIEILRQGTSEEPMYGLMQACAAAERAEGILAASLTMGYPWADVPDLGIAVVVVTDADDALAQATATGIARMAWSARHDFLGRGTPIEVAIGSLDAGDEDGPILLMDIGDNIGGGAAGDSVVLLDAALRAGTREILSIVVDPAASATSTAAGIGAEVELEIGSQIDPRWGLPLRVQGRVVGTASGRFEETGTSHGGQRYFDAGPTAAIDIGQGSVVVLTSKAVLPTSLEQVRSVGVEPSSFSVIIAKGVHSPRAAWEPICRRTIFVDTPGVTSADLSRLEFHQRRRPLFPFEHDATNQPLPPQGDR